VADHSHFGQGGGSAKGVAQPTLSRFDHPPPYSRKKIKKNKKLWVLAYGGGLATLMGKPSNFFLKVWPLWVTKPPPRVTGVAVSKPSKIFLEGLSLGHPAKTHKFFFSIFFI
jgi:hypothetical protein